MTTKLYCCMECRRTFKAEAERQYCTISCAGEAKRRGDKLIAKLQSKTASRFCVNCGGSGANFRGFCCRKCDRDFNIKYGVKEEDVAWEDRDE